MPLVETELEMVSRVARVKETSGGRLRHSTSFQTPKARAISNTTDARIFIVICGGWPLPYGCGSVLDTLQYFAFGTMGSR